MLDANVLVYGIEIETQNHEENHRPDRYDLDSSEYISEIAEEMGDRLEAIGQSDRRRAARRGDDIVISFDECWDTVADRVIDDWDCDGDKEIDICPPSQWERHTDGSVKGYEYVLELPKTYEETIESIKVFPWHNAEIDSECSHHIHVSWPNIQTTSTRQAKLLISLMYFSKVFTDEMRACIISRLEAEDRFSGRSGSWCEHYYPLRVTEERFAAVSRRKKGENPTYEFRIFGGIDSEELSIEAIDIVKECCVFASKDDFWDMKNISTFCDEGADYRRVFLDLLEGKTEAFDFTKYFNCQDKEEK